MKESRKIKIFICASRFDVKDDQAFKTRFSREFDSNYFESTNFVNASCRGIVSRDYNKSNEMRSQ